MSNHRGESYKIYNNQAEKYFLTWESERANDRTNKGSIRSMPHQSIIDIISKNCESLSEKTLKTRFLCAG